MNGISQRFTINLWKLISPNTIGRVKLLIEVGQKSILIRVKMSRSYVHCIKTQWSSAIGGCQRIDMLKLKNFSFGCEFCCGFWPILLWLSLTIGYIDPEISVPYFHTIDQIEIENPQQISNDRFFQSLIFFCHLDSKYFIPVSGIWIATQDRVNKGSLT